MSDHDRESLLKVEKLDLEVRDLKWKIAWSPWLESAKAFAVPLAIAVPLFIGIANLKQAQEDANAAREADRVQIDQARNAATNAVLEANITRLTGDRAETRLAGIAGLSPFLSDADFDRRLIAITMLVTRLQLEDDPVVIAAVLSTLQSVPADSPEMATATRALAMAVEANRRLLASAIAEGSQRLSPELRPGSQTPVGQIIAEGRIDRRPLGQSDPGRITALEALARAIEVLLAAGGALDEKGLAQIYCRGCNFYGTNLEGVDFTGSILDGSTFAFAKLAGSSFANASLSGVNFFAADLHGANLSVTAVEAEDGIVRVDAVDLSSLGPNNSQILLPSFECAILTGTNLAGRALVQAEADDTGIDVWTAQVDGAAIDETTVLNPLGLVWSVTTALNHDPELYRLRSSPYPFVRSIPSVARYVTTIDRIDPDNGFVARYMVNAVGDRSPAEAASQEALPALVSAIAWSELALGALPRALGEIVPAVGAELVPDEPVVLENGVEVERADGPVDCMGPARYVARGVTAFQLF